MKFQSQWFSAILILLPLFGISQNLFPDAGPVFKDDVIPRIDIILPTDSLDALYAPGNEESNYHYHATFIFDNGEINDTLENIGFRFRGNTSRFSAKKSFKVSFNTYEPGRQWFGLEKLNINGEHNDPSVCRAKLGWDLCRQMKIPAPRSNHVDLYINGEYWGIYINVEHIDEEFVDLRFGNKAGNLFKCLWPADLIYKGNDPDLYKESFGGRRAYTLQTNVELDNYEDIAHLIDVLNNTPIDDLACELEKVFNVDTYLKAIAMDILTANWDGPIYNKNNFYLYNNQATGKFEYIPYDLDNTFGIDWFNINWANRDIYSWDNSNEERPIYTRILEVPEYRKRYSYYMDQILQEIYQTDLLNAYLNNIRTFISPSAELDPLRPMDYGFSFEDFENSFEEASPASHTPIGLKPFIQERRFSALAQLVMQNIEPVISQISNNYPNEFQELSITSTVLDDVGISQVLFCYFANGIGVTCAEMFDDGQNNDGDADDSIYGIILSPFNESTTLDYYIMANDNTGLASRKPFCDFYQIYIGSSNIPLVINEFMASNNMTFADEFGEFDDWIELFNTSDLPVFLGDYFLSDNETIPDKWKMPEIWIQPEDFLIFWADKDEAQGEFHTNFKLSADGEFIGIFDTQENDFALIDGFNFDATDTDVAIGRIPNGSGPFQEVFPTPGAHNEPLITSIPTVNQELEVSVFPNPFSDYLLIEVNNPFQKKIHLSITDVFGKTVFDMAETNNSIGKFINTTKLSSGLYFVILSENGFVRKAQKILLSK